VSSTGQPHEAIHLLPHRGFLPPCSTYPAGLHRESVRGGATGPTDKLPCRQECRMLSKVCEHQSMAASAAGGGQAEGLMMHGHWRGWRLLQEDSPMHAFGLCCSWGTTCGCQGLSPGSRPWHLSPCITALLLPQQHLALFWGSTVTNISNCGTHACPYHHTFSKYHGLQQGLCFREDMVLIGFIIRG